MPPISHARTGPAAPRRRTPTISPGKRRARCPACSTSGRSRRPCATGCPRTRSSPTAPAITRPGCTRLYRYPRYRTQLAPYNGSMGYGVPAAIAAKAVESRSHRGLVERRRLLSHERAGARDRVSVRTGHRLHRRRQRHVRDDPHAPGARVSGTRLRHRPRQPGFRRARARLRRAAARPCSRTEEFAPALERALAAGRPALLHLRIDPQAITMNATIDEIRAAGAAAGERSTRAMTLSVSGLSVEFRTTERIVQAVRDVSFTLGRGETIAIVGESGSGKSVTALSIMRLVEHGGGRITSGSSSSCARAAPRSISRRPTPRRMRAIRGAEIAMIFQEPMTSLNPVFTVGEQIAEAIRLHQGHGSRRRQERGAAHARAGPHPGGATGARALSAPALRRHAAAGDDRDGAFLQAEAADRRRADDGARRDDPGADPRADPPAAGRDAHGGDVHHPRHGRRRRSRRSRGGDVPRRESRGWHRRSDLPRAAASVHAGAALGGAEARLDARTATRRRHFRCCNPTARRAHPRRARPSACHRAQSRC